MLNSINNPSSISDKFRNRYGEIWANLDFMFEDKISAENFKTDPMNCTIGTLTLQSHSIKMRYKDLISYAKQIETFTMNMYASRPTKTDVFPIDIKGRSVLLLKHEVAKLNETLNDALMIALRKYELGLYL